MISYLALSVHIRTHIDAHAEFTAAFVCLSW